MKRSIKYQNCIFLFCISFFCISAIYSQEQPPEGESDLGNAIQNPVADIVSIPFQNNLDFNDVNKNTLNIQPVLPFAITENVNLIFRNIIPVISGPDLSSPFGGKTSGIGNISTAMLFTPAKPGKIIWAVGPTLTWGSVTPGLGFEKFALAPSALGLYQNNGWTIGVIAQNSWSVAGPSDSADINLFYAQIFIVKNLANGWYVNSAPIITANWEAPSGSQWNVPLGAGFGRLFRVNKLPINAQIGWYSYLTSADDSSGQLRFQLQFILPKLY
jgi:hypothetical protein